MDQRLNKHESGQRAILEQMMKMQQDFKVQSAVYQYKQDYKVQGVQI